jgi:hypothetical protein
MNQILFLRFIKTTRQHWPGIAAILVAATIPVSAAVAQNQFSNNQPASFSGSWESPANQATRIPDQQPPSVVQQAGGNVNIGTSWPDKPVAFESQIQPTNHGTQHPSTQTSLETTLGTANLAVAGLKQKATDLMGNFGGQASELKIAKMLSSLAIVLGAYFGFVWLVRRLHPGSNSQLPTEVVQILGHTSFGPKQNLQLVRLGHKLLLLLNGPEGSHPIGEITDAAEVDYLTSLCNSKSKRRVAPPRPSATAGSQPANSPAIGTAAPSQQAHSMAFRSSTPTSKGTGLTDILRSLENVVKQNGGNVFEA